VKVERVGFFCDHTSGAGGGEHYAFSVARALARRWPVDLLVRAERFIPDRAVFADALGLDLSTVDLHPRVLQSPRDVGRYDLFVNLSHFTVLPPTARRNLLAIFFPQLQSEWVRDYDLIATISRYSAEWITKYWGATDVAVAYPPVSASHVAPVPKERLIVSTGRFFEADAGNNKNHLLMVRAFKTLRARGLTDWRLVLAGSTAPEHAGYLARVRAEADGAPVAIVTDAPFEALRDLYARAAIYWHAAGFDRDGLTLVPSAAEHFGIAIVEAMAAGAVPIVPDTGGPTEIVTEPEDGLRAQTLEQFVEKSAWLMTHDEDRAALAARARVRSRDFAVESFDRRFDALVDVCLDDDPGRKAQFFLGEQNYAAAERFFADAADRYPTTAAPYDGLAECFYRTGRRELALAMWKRALEVEPGAAGTDMLGARVARIERQRAAVTRVRSGELFGESYFESGTESGINDYSEYDGASWSRTHAEIINAAFAPTTCLDIGCAKGDFVREMRGRGVRAFGTDLSSYSVAAATSAVRSLLCASSMAALPYTDDAFDLVVAIEVLEHLPPEQVDEALDELWRVARQFVYITVQNTTAADPEHFFADLTHSTMKPLAWWQDRFRRHRFHLVPTELPFGEFRQHQIVAQPLGKFDRVTDAELDARLEALVGEVDGRRRAADAPGAVRALEQAINLLDLLDQEGRRRPGVRHTCYAALAQAYREQGLEEQAAAAAARAQALAEQEERER